MKNLRSKLIGFLLTEIAVIMIFSLIIVFDKSYILEYPIARIGKIWFFLKSWLVVSVIVGIVGLAIILLPIKVVQKTEPYEETVLKEIMKHGGIITKEEFEKICPSKHTQKKVLEKLKKENKIVMIRESILLK